MGESHESWNTLAGNCDQCNYDFSEDLKQEVSLEDVKTTTLSLPKMQLEAAK